LKISLDKSGDPTFRGGFEGKNHAKTGQIPRLALCVMIPSMA
jgi:hypothetical protein